MAPPRKDRIKTTCGTCGAVFDGEPWRPRRYCSAACYRATQTNFKVDGDTWTCTRCKTVKPLSDFRIRRTGRPYSWCKACVNATSQSWMAAHPEKAREYRLKSDYGLTSADIDDLRHQQGDRCAACRQRWPSSKRMHVDHDHDTGTIRGLLCSNCNMVLGLTHDDAEWLTRLAAYLRR